MEALCLGAAALAGFAAAAWPDFAAASWPDFAAAVRPDSAEKVRPDSRREPERNGRGIREDKRNRRDRRKNRYGESRGMRGIWRMLLLLCVFLAGFMRMQTAAADWREMEERQTAFLPDGSQTVISGIVKDIREKERFYVVTVEDAAAERAEWGDAEPELAEWGDAEREGAEPGRADLKDAEQTAIDIGSVLVYVEKKSGSGKEKRSEDDSEDGTENGSEDGTEIGAGPGGSLNLEIGGRVRGWGAVSYFKTARNPGQFDLKRYYRSQGISMACFADAVSQSGPGSPLLDGLYRFRRGCSRILEEICEKEDLGIFRAAILGEKEGMDGEQKDLYQRNGIAHLLAISGLHLSLIGMGLHRLLRRNGLGYGAAGTLAGGLILCYGWMTGASGSAMRAVIMLSAAFLAEYLGRTYDLLSALSLAALLLAHSRPFLLETSGFQLSFGAVLGIGLLGSHLVKGLGASKKWQQNLIISLSIQLMTCPIVLWHYFQYPVYGILLNLLVVPLMGYVVVSGIAGIGLGWLIPALGTAAVGTGHYILALYQLLCLRFSELPGHQAVWGRPGWHQIGLYYGILAGLTLFLDMRGRRRERQSSDAVLLTAGALCCFFCLRPGPQRGCDITFLDVGQGDGIVIQCEKDGVVLIDGGSTSEKNLGEDCLEPYLKSEGISQVDAAVVSHGDRDHISGLLYLLEESRDIRIGSLILPEAGKEDAGYEELLRAAEAEKVPVAYLAAGGQIQAGDCRFSCLYPAAGEEIDPSDRNQQSLILKMDYQDFHLLLTGDADQEGERRMIERTGGEALADIQVLKAAHHGSRFSNSEALLKASSPELAVISYQEGNSYGHPHEEALERME
ncbi:MAG: DNA internalization-related competence protein ComEC/Rec2, partial [Lachnospiraceae bacterium]|nr:DNA internalization-related competence protein ComEC/Rec2 [Lachnospiraceae bacterium]